MGTVAAAVTMGFPAASADGASLGATRTTRPANVMSAMTASAIANLCRVATSSSKRVSFSASHPSDGDIGDRGNLFRSFAQAGRSGVTQEESVVPAPIR